MCDAQNFFAQDAQMHIVLGVLINIQNNTVFAKLFLVYCGGLGVNADLHNTKMEDYNSLITEQRHFKRIVM